MIRLRPHPFLIDGLHNLCSKLENIDTIVEIGSYIGESTEVFAKNFPKSTIYSVDPYIPNYDKSDNASNYMNDVENEFIKLLDIHPNIKKIKKLSSDAVKDFDDNSIDFVYIDANHTYESVKQDIILWLPKVKKYIGFHDYDNYDVKRAINEFIGIPLGENCFVDNSVIFKII